MALQRGLYCANRSDGNDFFGSAADSEACDASAITHKSLLLR